MQFNPFALKVSVERLMVTTLIHVSIKLLWYLQDVISFPYFHITLKLYRTANDIPIKINDVSNFWQSHAEESPLEEWTPSTGLPLIHGSLFFTSHSNVVYSNLFCLLFVCLSVCSHYTYSMQHWRTQASLKTPEKITFPT